MTYRSTTITFVIPSLLFLSKLQMKQTNVERAQLLIFMIIYKQTIAV